MLIGKGSKLFAPRLPWPQVGKWAGALEVCESASLPLRLSSLGDFKSQLTTALSTLRENLLAEKAALRDSMEAEKQRDIEAHVTAARAEYEAVMNKYEQSTEAWRRDTVAACERSLDAARLQVSAATSLQSSPVRLTFSPCRLPRRAHRRRHKP